jgi:hypothetical protein
VKPKTARQADPGFAVQGEPDGFESCREPISARSADGGEGIEPLGEDVLPAGCVAAAKPARRDRQLQGDVAPGHIG